MFKTVVYHDVFCKIKTPKITKNIFKKYFGDSFYCTVLKAQAIKWAKNMIHQ